MAFPRSPSWDTWGFAADNLPGAAAPVEPENGPQLVKLEAKTTCPKEKGLDEPEIRPLEKLHDFGHKSTQKASQNVTQRCVHNFLNTDPTIFTKI